jgi:Phytanoyl-CoA dioxygenase (PhyH)
MERRFTEDQLAAWRRDGGVVIPGFFTADEVAAVVADFEMVFGSRAGADVPLVKRRPGEIGGFAGAQFRDNDTIPLPCSPALNLIGLHPALVDFARAALQTDDIRLYQCEAWAKFTGDADYDQPFHCDFANHTLTVPSEDPRQNAVTIICYFSDVTEAHGPAHFVPRPDSDRIAGPEVSFHTDPEVQAQLQTALAPLARSSAAPAGSIFPYAIDTYHRGTNLTAPGGFRYAMMVAYRAAATDAIQRYAWPFHHTRPWRTIFEHATPEQLALFGVPLPGHRYWTDETVRRTRLRYPGWNAAPYLAALTAPAG